MRTPWAMVLQGAAGAFVGLAALGVVHHDFRPVVALGVAAVASGVCTLARPSWSGLPRFVAAWLELGVVTVTALLAVVAHALSHGLPYMVLRTAELTAIGGTAVLLGVAVAGLVYTHSRLAREVQAHQQKVDALERRALQSRLTALTAQIHPHFLFNTLNTLAELIHEDEDQAEELVTDLAAMMRYALRSSVVQVPLREELDVVRRLLRIEHARLGERLRWRIEGDPGEVMVPGMLVQPLVENAVQHGVAARPEGGEVVVVVRELPDGVLLVVSDDGPGLPPELVSELEGGPREERGTGGAGGGLHNVAERLHLYWPGGGARLDVDPSYTGTRLTLMLPKRQPVLSETP